MPNKKTAKRKTATKHIGITVNMPGLTNVKPIPPPQQPYTTADIAAEYEEHFQNKRSIELLKTANHEIKRLHIENELQAARLSTLDNIMLLLRGRVNDGSGRTIDGGYELTTQIEEHLAKFK